MVPKLKSRKEVHWEKRTAIKTNEPKGPPLFPVMPTLAAGTYRTAQGLTSSVEEGHLEMRNAKRLAQFLRDRKR